MNKIKEQNKIKTETFAHHAMAAVGGFFGVYALFTRGETFGSSETSNLIYLVVSGLKGDAKDLLIRLGATLCYIAAIMVATVGMRKCKRFDFRYVSVAVDLLAIIVLAMIPASVDPVLALYPMFFATALQWVAYTNAAGFKSATIFSTNNLRQCFAGLSEYFCTHEREYLRQFIYFGSTLICFHLGVVWAWFAVQWWGIASIYGCLLPLAVGTVATLMDRGAEE